MKEKKIQTQKINCDQVSNHINDILNAKCIFIHGEDHFQKDKCFKFVFDKIKKHIVETSQIMDSGLINDGINTFLFYGDEYSTDKKIISILDTLNMIPFDMSEKIVSIRYFEEIKIDAASIIAKYTENPSSFARLIIVSDKVDGKFGAYKKIKENSLCIETTEMKYQSHLSKWLENYIRDNKIKMDDKAKQFFLEITDIDTFTAYNEMKKIEIYKGNNTAITIDDIKNCTIHSKINAIFELTEAVGFRQKNKALMIAENLIENGESIIVIISTLVNFFYNLWKWDALRRKGISNNELTTNYMGNIHQFIKDKNIRYLNAFNHSQIKAALKHLYITDCRVKLTMADEKVLITSLVLEILK